jgi:lipooligosaccharide transport system ATP-binding protein
MRILAATSTRTSGTVEILDKDPEKFGPLVRAHLGIVPQEDNLDGELTVTENLFIFSPSKFVSPIRYLSAPRYFQVL